MGIMSTIKTTAFAEVIASTLRSFTAQCWKWNQTPQFGSLITVQSGKTKLFGLVSDVQTGSSDPTRSPFPYQKTEEELMRDQPQIFEFLQTTFHVILLGSEKDGEVSFMVPEEPARIHGFVAPATQEEINSFLTNSSFLPLLFAGTESTAQVDELFLALLRTLAQEQLLTAKLFEQFYQQLSLLCGNDYRRLKILLQRISSHYSKVISPLIESFSQNPIDR